MRSSDMAIVGGTGYIRQAQKKRKRNQMKILSLIT